MPEGIRARTSASPATSSEDTGSSNQATPCSANAWASRTAPAVSQAPLASTISSTPSPTAARATATRRGSSAGSRPTFIFTRGMPSAAQPPSCSVNSASEYEQNPPEPYTGTVSRRRPSSETSDVPSARALRSHSATSTAATAYIASPHGPALRTAATIAPQAPGTSSGSRPSSAGSSSSRTSPPTAAGAYVQPSPVAPAADTSTTTSVVFAQANVPSDSGRSVGTV